MTDELQALAARVEALTGPCRETDALIAAALRIGTEHAWAHNYPAWQGRDDGRVYLENGGPSFAAARYTASLDAAMTLVPVLAFWRLGHDGEGEDPGLFKSHILSWTDGTVRSQRNSIAIAATPALALTAAALRALASKEPEA